jgi:hypothetical protein
MNEGSAQAQHQVPASGPKLLPAVQQARQHLETLRPILEPKDVGLKVWSRLLELTEKVTTDGTAVVLRRDDLDAALGIELTRRVWVQKVLRWYDLKVRASLAAVATGSGIPALEPGRISDRSGGRPEVSQAQYFVAFPGVRSAGHTAGARPEPRHPRQEPQEAASRSSLGRSRTDQTEAIRSIRAVALHVSQSLHSVRDTSLGVLVAYFALLAFLAFVASQTNQTIQTLTDAMQELVLVLGRLLGPWLS